MPISRRRPPFPWRTSSDPRRASRSRSESASASWTRSPARQSTTTIARSRQPWRSSRAWRMTADELLDRWRVGRVLKPLVARRAPGVVARQCRRRATPTSRIEQRERIPGSSSSEAADRSALSTTSEAQPPREHSGLRRSRAQPAASPARAGASTSSQRRRETPAGRPQRAAPGAPCGDASLPRGFTLSRGRGDCLWPEEPRLGSGPRPGRIGWIGWP